MIAFPNCKINIGLFVTAERPDGYHNIESVMLPVPFFDVLEIVQAEKGEAKIKVTGIKIPGDPRSNLCLKAYRALKTKYDLPPVRMHLHKIIPPGSGLGGGSSDGAFTLKMLNELFGIGLTSGQLENYAGELGSDCPFFIKNLPAFVFEKGDRLQTITSRLSGYYLVLVIPGISIDTGQAYAK